METRIDTSKLNTEERNELAKMLFKCEYSIRLVKEKDNGKVKQYIAFKKD